MQCDFCDSKATVFFTQIINGKSKKTCLCENCAASQGVMDPEGFLLGGMHPPGAPQQQPPKAAATGLPAKATPAGNQGICPGCGFASDDLKKTGRLGCSQCYQFFREEIISNLGSMHKGTRHTGRVPQGMLETHERLQRMESLKAEMHEAISAENYEKAAALRDEIRSLSENTTPEPSPNS